MSLCSLAAWPCLAPCLQLAERLGSMGSDEFSKHVEELAKAKLERPRRLREVAGRDWAEIERGSLRCRGQEGGGLAVDGLREAAGCEERTMFCCCPPRQAPLQDLLQV